MKISTLLRHVQFEAGIKNPDMRSRLAAAGLRIGLNTLSLWRGGHQRPNEANDVVIRSVCARLHTCEQCEGEPAELRDPPPKPKKLPFLGVSPTENRTEYNRRFAVWSGLMADGEASTKLWSDADAVAMACDGANVREVRGRWRISLPEELQIDAAIERLAAEEAK